MAKQTIYRWWNTKTEILLDAFLQDAAEDLTPPGHGDLGRDLRAYRLPLEREPGGQLPAGLDIATEVDQLVGPIYHRVLVTGDPINQAFTDRLVDNFLHRLPVASPA